MNGGQDPALHVERVMIHKLNVMSKDMQKAMTHYDGKNMMALQQVTIALETLNVRITALELCETNKKDLGFLLCTCKHPLDEHDPKCKKDGCSCQGFALGEQPDE